MAFKKLQKGKYSPAVIIVCHIVFVCCHLTGSFFLFQYVQTDPPTAKSLSTSITQVIQFQEDTYGKNVAKPPLTRIPTRCFLDFRPNGGICQILATVYKYLFFYE